MSSANLCPALSTAPHQPNRAYATQIRDWEIQPPFSPVTVALWALFPAHSPSWITTGNSPSCLLIQRMCFHPRPFAYALSSVANALPAPALGSFPLSLSLDCAPQLLYPIHSLSYAFLCFILHILSSYSLCVI